MSEPTLDCGDSSCMFALKKTGMRTNGGCVCLEELPRDKRVKISHLVCVLREEVKRLRAQVNQMLNE